MKINGHLDLQGNMLRNVTLEPLTSWPAEPKPGSFLFKDKRVYVCLSIEEAIPVWLPMSNELQTHVHDQFNAATEWVIDHQLQAAGCILQVLNSDNHAIEYDEAEFVFNQAIVRFAEPQSGRAILVHGATEGIPRLPVAHQQTFPEESVIWVVNHNLGYEPIIRAFSGQMEIQPYAIAHSEDGKTATLTFSSPVSGRVRCV